MKIFIKLSVVIVLLFGCNSGANNPKTKNVSEKTALVSAKSASKLAVDNKIIAYNGKAKTIHILVALCDNKYQGIVPVPKNIGNGQNPKSNLYWGAGYGIKTFFKRSKEWQLIKSTKVNDTILERLLFKHRKKDFYLVADAYDGQYIEQTTIDFIKSSAGLIKDTLHIGTKVIGINGNANLVSYIGHDGLMDFELHQSYKNIDNIKRDIIILACYSKHYFLKFMKEANANPLVWTSGLMAPEAYTIHDAITGYVNGESNEKIRLRAARAYSKYQKCSLRASKNLLVNSWN